MYDIRQVGIVRSEELLCFVLRNYSYLYLRLVCGDALDSDGSLACFVR